MTFGPFFQINIIDNLEEFITWRKVESSIRFAGNGATFPGDSILDLQETCQLGMSNCGLVLVLQSFDQILHDTALASGARPDNSSEVICKKNLEQSSF